MTALAADKARHRSGEALRTGSVPAQAATTVFAGSLVSVISGGAAGYGIPGATATTHIALGVATKGVANAGAAGAKTIPYEEGVFEFDITSSEIDQGDVGALAYITDDNEVGLVSTGKSVAGKIVGIGPNGGALVLVGLGQPKA